MKCNFEIILTRIFLSIEVNIFSCHYRILFKNIFKIFRNKLNFFSIIRNEFLRRNEKYFSKPVFHRVIILIIFFFKVYEFLKKEFPHVYNSGKKFKNFISQFF